MYLSIRSDGPCQMHGLKMDGGCCDTETTLPLSPKTLFTDMPELVYAAKKKKSAERRQRRLVGYKRHHSQKESDFGEFIKQVYTQEEHDTKELKKKYLDSKNKKTKKEKVDKNTKKNDVLPVTAINDENRTSAYQRANTATALASNCVNGTISSSSAVNIKTVEYDLFRHNTSPNFHDGSPPEHTFPHGLYGMETSFPDFLDTGSLDDLLSTGNEQSSDSSDIGRILEEMSDSLPDALRERVFALDAFSPLMPYESGGKEIKNESAPTYLNDLNGFLSPDSRGSNSTPNSFVPQRSNSGSIPSVGPPIIQRTTPDNVKPSEIKRFLPSQMDGKGLPSFPGMRQNPAVATIPSERQYNPHQKPVSPFASMHDPSMRLDPQQNTVGPVIGSPHGNMCFSPHQNHPHQNPHSNPHSQGVLLQQSSHESPYMNAHSFGRQMPQSQHQLPYEAVQIQQRQVPMRTNQMSPGVSARWHPDMQPTYQQSTMPVTSLAYANTPNEVISVGFPQVQQGPYGNMQTVYGSGQMVQTRPSGAQYALSNVRTPQYRTMMPSTQQSTATRMFVNPGVGNGAGPPYVNHMQNASVYQANMEQQTAMRQMTGYRPTYIQQQPVKTGLQQQQQQHYTQSTNINPVQQQQQLQSQQTFFQMQQQQQPNNTFTVMDQQGYIQSHGDPYGRPGTWAS